MRMSNYYLALALVLAPALVATAVLGLTHDGSQRHLMAGLVTAVAAVATNTVFILFMIVTGRVLRAAIQARPLPREFLAELNDFFVAKKAYPMALIAAAVAVAAAVLGYGPHIGVPSWIHALVGIAAVVVNLVMIPTALATLRANQVLLDRAARTLDRLDRELGPAPEEASAIPWSYGPRTRWMVFAVSAWGPYLYWGLVVWRGEFSALSPVFLVGSALVSLLGLWRALASARSQPSAS